MCPGVDHTNDRTIDLPQRYEAELHVLYVVGADAYSSSPGDEYVHEFEGLEKALEQVGRDAVEEITDRAETSNVETQSVIRHGVPHGEILQYIDEAALGLTIVVSETRSRQYRQLLDRVAERVANMAERPATIVTTPVSE